MLKIKASEKPALADGFSYFLELSAAY